MKRKSLYNPSRKLASLAVWCLLAAVPFSNAYAQNQLEEIIITARKTEENLQEVPIAVTAHTGDALKDAGITEFAQVASVTPNFDARADDVRGEFAAVLNIRGQSSTTSDLTIDQAVGINVNGAPITRGTNLFGNLFDIEQIEILKGPQGTLFGKNTTGGLVIVTTKAPQLGENSGYVEATIGNFGQADFEAVGNVALGEDSALRLGAAVTSRDGFGDGVRSDGSDSGIDLGNDDEEFFRLSYLYNPSDDFSLRINADTHEVDEYGAVIRALLPAFPIAQPPATDRFFTGANFNDGVVLPHSDLPSVTAEETNVNATIEADLGFARLTSITSYRDQESETDLNFTPLGGIVIGQNSELLAQELRLSGATDKFKWQTGLFISNEEGDDRNNTIGRGQVTAVENDSFSIFAQGTFTLTDSLSLTAGLRYTDEERSVEMKELALAGGSIAQARQTFGTTTTADGRVVLNGLGTTIENEADFDAVSYTLALDYKVSDDQLVYGSISRGFRSGGIDGDGDLSTEVEPEFVDNIEIGYKGDFLDKTLRWNTALWYSDYTDIQIQSFSLDATVAGTQGVPVAVLNNAAEAELYGLESEIEWLPTDNFSVRAGIGYTKGDYSEFFEPRLNDPNDPTQGVFQFDRSDEPIGGPELQFNLTGRYTFEVGDKTRGGFQLTYTHIDERVLESPAVIDLVNSKAAGIRAMGGFVGEEDNYGIVDSIDLINTQLDFQIGDALNVALWAKNITDEEYFSNGFALAVFGGLAQRTIGAPRQYGITVKYDF